MKKVIGLLVCLLTVFVSTYVYAAEQRFSTNVYDLTGESRNVANVIFFSKNDDIDLSLTEYRQPRIEVEDNILLNSKTGEYFIIMDIKSDNKENLYSEISPTEFRITQLNSIGGGVGLMLGKDYRLLYAESEQSDLTDISEKIINSSRTSINFAAEKLGTYILYFNPAVYGVTFYSDMPTYDSDGNLVNPESVHNEISDLNRNDIIDFPVIPKKDGCVFTGWKAWSGNGIYFIQPQPLTVASYGEYYASWCLESEYEPIKIEIEADGAITKGKENGHKVTLKTDYGIFIKDDEFPSEWRSIYEAETDKQTKTDIISEWKSKWNVIGCDDIIIESAQRIDDKTVELTLSGNSKDVYSNSEIYIEFDNSILKPEPFEDNGEIIYDVDTKIKMDNNGVRAKMYKSDNAITLLKRNRISGGSGGIARYTVTFDTNGGSMVAKQTVQSNSAAAKPKIPEKDGYEFAGWFTDKALVTEYDFNTNVTKNITLYAKWNEIDIRKSQIKFKIGEKNAAVFGETKSNDVAPIIRGDRAFLPARFTAENLGASVEWNNDTETVTITKNDVKIVIAIGAETAVVNGEIIKLDCPAFIENDRTYTPIRFVAENLGAVVDWEPENQIITITEQRY